MITAFLDTNIFVHFVPINEINWEEILKTDDIEIRIIPVVLSELDKIKTDSNSRKRERAIKSLKLLTTLEELFRKGGEVPKGVDFMMIFDGIDALEETFKKYGLHKDFGDDRLLASILEYDNKWAVGPNPKILITDDTGLMLRARQFGLDAITLPDKYRVKIIEDKKDNDIKKV